MKKNAKAKLNLMQLSKEQLKTVQGAGVRACGCFCRWADQGGSSPIDNSGANLYIQTV